MKDFFARVLSVIAILIITLFVVLDGLIVRGLILAPVILAYETGKISFLFFMLITVPLAQIIWDKVDNLFAEEDEEDCLE